MKPKHELKLELSEGERKELVKLMQEVDRKGYGDMVRDMVLRAIKKAGGILGRKIKPDKMDKEVEIYKEGRVVARLDIVAESEDGRPIVIEVKSTIDPEGVWREYREAWRQVKVEVRSGEPGYMQLIEEHGLEFFDEIRKDVEAYIIIVVKIDEKTGLLSIEVMKEVPKG